LGDPILEGMLHDLNIAKGLSKTHEDLLKDRLRQLENATKIAEELAIKEKEDAVKLKELNELKKKLA
jgi:hypothetical protein